MEPCIICLTEPSLITHNCCLASVCQECYNKCGSLCPICERVQINEEIVQHDEISALDEQHEAAIRRSMERSREVFDRNRVMTTRLEVIVEQVKGRIGVEGSERRFERVNNALTIFEKFLNMEGTLEEEKNMIEFFSLLESVHYSNKAPTLQAASMLCKVYGNVPSRFEY